MTRTSTLDLVPLQRFAVGFDQLFNDMDRLYMNSNSTNNYPPYNLVKVNDNEFVISLAVAGFKMEDLDITHSGNVLSIEGLTPQVEDTVYYIHKGIASRGFKRVFTVADHIEVESANLEYGILNIYLKRQVPEHLQPKKITIKG